MNIKDIAATLAILGSGALIMSGCGKDQPATEVPGGGGEAAADGGGGEEAAPADGGEAAAEASCGGDGHTEEGHCGGEDGGGEEAAADGEGEGSCGGK